MIASTFSLYQTYIVYGTALSFCHCALFAVIVVGRIALDDIYHAKKVKSKPVAHIW
jgi:hypothetical protein